MWRHASCEILHDFIYLPSLGLGSSFHRFIGFLSSLVIPRRAVERKDFIVDFLSFTRAAKRKDFIVNFLSFTRADKRKDFILDFLLFTRPL